MKTFNVTFYLSGHFMETSITAYGYTQARMMIEAQYRGATSISLSEV